MAHVSRSSAATLLRTSLLVALVLMVAACGESSEPAATGVDNITTTSTPAATTTTTTTLGTTTTLPTDVPGDPVAFGPAPGEVLTVVGVAHDDVLNVRRLPGVDQPIVAEAEPTATDVLAMGHTRQQGSSLWSEVEADDGVGWVNHRYVAYIGDTVDDTARIVGELGENPTADSMEELGLVIAEAMASEDPPSQIVVSVAPSLGDLGAVTYDVIGLGDDSVYGLRLHVFGTPAENGEGFVLKSVETTTLCGRGVSGGLCV